MAITTASTGQTSIARPKWRPLEGEGMLAALLLLPTLTLLSLFIAYPFLRGMLLAVTDAKVGVPGKWVGFDNFTRLLGDPIFHAVVKNTFLYTAVTTVFKLALGLWLAILLNRDFKFKAFTRAFILLPFIVPTVLACFAWKWMFDPTFSVVNWFLWKLGVITQSINWLGDGDLAMLSIIIVNVWRGVPFFAISLMAGLQTIAPDLQEAAAIDGAKPWQRFIYITWPLLLPVTMVVVLFSVIQTFADFQIVYVMTGGGPANATHLFATYAYQLGIGTGLLSQGAAVSLAMFPLLFLIVIFQLLYIRKVETR
ncbi:MAG: carbohydrate ABC transporter permease [Hyphomicrobiaceae bacterium]